MQITIRCAYQIESTLAKNSIHAWKNQRNGTGVGKKTVFSTSTRSCFRTIRLRCLFYFYIGLLHTQDRGLTAFTAYWRENPPTRPPIRWKPPSFSPEWKAKPEFQKIKASTFIRTCVWGDVSIPFRCVWSIGITCMSFFHTNAFWILVSLNANLDPIDY